MRRVWHWLRAFLAELDGNYCSSAWLRDQVRRSAYGGVERHTGSIKFPVSKHG